MAVAGQELIHGFGESELQIHHPAVAEDHDKEAQASARRSDLDRPELTPVHLSAFSGSKLQHEKGGFARRPELAHQFLEDGIATGIALLPELLQDLLSCEGVALEHGHDLPLEGIELTWPLRSLPGLVASLMDPLVDGLGIELQLLGDLGNFQEFLVMETADLAEGLIVDQPKKIQSEENGISNRRFSSTFIPPLTGPPHSKSIPASQQCRLPARLSSLTEDGHPSAAARAPAGEQPRPGGWFFENGEGEIQDRRKVGKRSRVSLLLLVAPGGALIALVRCDGISVDLTHRWGALFVETEVPGQLQERHAYGEGRP